jgi:hypothetical protein
MKHVLIKIRLIQLKREVQKLGFFYTLLLIFLLAAASLYAGICYHQPQTAVGISAAILLAVVYIHFNRKDLGFINKHIPYPAQNIYAGYMVFSLPFALPAVFSPQWFHYPVVLLLLGCIAVTKVDMVHKTPLPHLGKLVRADAFEWIGGIRKRYISLALLFAIAAALCWLRIAPLIFLFLITTTILSFYIEGEPLQVLYAYGSNAKKMLHKKMKTHLAMLSLLQLPVLVINSIFNPDLVLLNTAFWIVQLILLSFVILLKYATYEPGRQNMLNSTLIAFVSLGCILPFILPVPLIMNFINYHKAIKKLQLYYHDKAAETKNAV